jgi:diguanylate cyclase (GGDEF)-like protein
MPTPSAISQEEAIVHEMARALEDVKDAKLVERTLLDRLIQLTKATSVQWMSEGEKGDARAGRSESDAERTTATPPEVSRATGCTQPGVEIVELKLRAGGKCKRHMRLLFSTTNPPHVSDATVTRVETLCTLATLALQRLERQEHREPSGPNLRSPYFPDNTNASVPMTDRASGPVFEERVALPVLQDATFLNAVLPFAVGQARRHGEPLSLLCVAVDRLSGIRELLGTGPAEKAARSVGEHIARSLRASDFVCRIEDDRIIAALPRAGLYDACQIAHRMCRTIEKTSTLIPEPPLLTVSIGVSEFPSCAETVYALLDSADHALTLAQNQGRNRVVSAETLPQPSLKAMAHVTA